jgi:hypothetical protein
MKRLIASVIAVAVFFAVGIVLYYAGLSARPQNQPPSVPVPAADAAKFAGTYERGDGLGTRHLTLNADGSYAATWGHKDLGLQGEAIGAWRVSGQTLVLSPFNETGTMDGYLRALDIVPEGGGFVLVRPEDRVQLKEQENTIGEGKGAHTYALACWSFQREDRRATTPEPWE